MLRHTVARATAARTLVAFGILTRLSSSSAAAAAVGVDAGEAAQLRARVRDAGLLRTTGEAYIDGRWLAAAAAGSGSGYYAVRNPATGRTVAAAADCGAAEAEAAVAAAVAAFPAWRDRTAR
ncbi:hypothetical protein HK405_001906, partial [Cladochytrium tenue]